MRLRLSPVPILLFSVTAPLSAQARCDAPYTPAADSIQEMVNRLGLGGAALIIRREGRPICERYYGSWRPETVVPLVSSAKWMSAAGILALTDDGTVALDDSAGKYLDYFRKGDKRGITLRFLLSHRSGLPDYSPCMFQPELPRDECARQIAEKSKLRHPPGAAFAYGGAAFTVAGRMAEVAAGRPWVEIFASRIAQPLGLKQTGYGNEPNALLSEGQPYSSPSDYIVFLEMILHNGMHAGRRVLSERAIGEMTRVQTTGASVAFSPREKPQYGLGCWIDLADSTGKGVVITSPGGGGFLPWVDREHGIVGVIAVKDRLERTGPTSGAVIRLVRSLVASSTVSAGPR
ncbi:MAG TPA: serine hydrolase domain-containing protein [Gemmatimonadales bacterium]|jgi:CubicO group peptidase (beta-lactamase class C family)|nr:serine hydrolase domain-containing protein [Gemmatimonadales bacterium]